MGAFYGSVHVRCDDVERLRRALEGIAERTKTRFSTPQRRTSWLCVYPSEMGQDVAIAAAISMELSCPVLHLLVHDGDVFFFNLFERGVLCDAYCSRPDYFGKAADERRMRAPGPSSLSDVVGVDAQRIERVLDAELSAVEQLQQLGKLLKLRRVDTCYEYLREGLEATAELPGSVHIPSLDERQRVARELRAKVDAEAARLKHEGVLFIERTASDWGSRPVFCADRSHGFLCAWSHLGRSALEPLERWSRPFVGPEDIGIRVSPTVTRLTTSKAGRFLAAGHAYGDWRVQLWDLPARRELVRVELGGATDQLTFSPDEQTLVCIAEGQLSLISMEPPYARARVQLAAGSTCCAFHPDGRWLLCASYAPSGATLSLVELSTQRVVRAWPMGASEAPRPPGPREAVSYHPLESARKLGFSRDGAWFVAVVEQGVRVYAWQELLGAEASLPKPIASSSSAEQLADAGTHVLRSQMTYDFAIDEARRSVLFSGLSGHIGELSIDTGETQQLLEIPGAHAVWGLWLDEDGGALITTSGAEPSRNRSPGIASWHAWDLRRLRAR